MTNRLFRFGLACSGLVVVFSWIASAMGFDIRNVMSAEGSRWILMYGIQRGAMLYLPHAISLSVLIALGKQNWNDSSGANCFRRLNLKKITPFILFLILLLLALLPGSPLRGVGGGIFPSPLSHAVFPLLVLLVLSFLLPYSKQSIIASLRKALYESADIIILFPIFAFLWNLIRYVWF